MKFEFSLEHDEFPWPQHGDELFTSNGNPHFNACLNFTHDKLNLYATGYRTVAQQLIAQVLEERFGIDSLIYPIIFLYRHYMELRMKELIREGRRLIDHDESFPKDHPLNNLWRLCRQVIEKALPEDCKNDPEVLKIMDNYINQFAKLDNGSFAFRYPMKKDDSSSLPVELDYINLESFSCAIERAANFLDAVSCAISENLSCKTDMEAEYAAEMRSFEAEIENEYREYYSDY